MNKTNDLYKLFENMYGTTFNRTLTIGTRSTGYNTYQINNINELCDKFKENHHKNEFYISLYDYDSSEESITWNKIDDNQKFDNYAIKNCILFRFKNRSDDINEELKLLPPIKHFTFIRRLINLGYNKSIVSEAKETYETIKKLFNIESTMIFNGLDECLLYVYFKPLELKNPTLTLYYFYKFIENYSDLKTLSYKEIEPYSQIVSLPGSQNNVSRLYIHKFDIDDTYAEIIKKSESPNIVNSEIKKDQNTAVLENLLETLDKEISKRQEVNQYTTVEYDLDDLFKMR